MEARIEQLNMNKESIEGDIGAEILTPQAYLNNVKKYLKWEQTNLKKA
jgi:hypothetical protein